MSPNLSLTNHLGRRKSPLVTDVSQGSSQWLPSRVSGRGRKPRQGPTHANTRPKAPGMAAIGATRGQKGALARQQRLLHATVSSFNCKPPRGHLFRHVSDPIHYIVQFLGGFILWLSLGCWSDFLFSTHWCPHPLWMTGVHVRLASKWMAPKRAIE